MCHMETAREDAQMRQHQTGNVETAHNDKIEKWWQNTLRRRSVFRQHSLRQRTLGCCEVDLDSGVASTVEDLASVDAGHGERL